MQSSNDSALCTLCSALSSRRSATHLLFCVAVPSISSLSFDNSYARLSPEFYEVVDPTPLPGLSLVAFNPDAAQLIDLDAAVTTSSDLAS